MADVYQKLEMLSSSSYLTYIYGTQLFLKLFRIKFFFLAAGGGGGKANLLSRLLPSFFDYLPADSFKFL